MKTSVKLPNRIDLAHHRVFALWQDEEVISKSVPPPVPSGSDFCFWLEEVGLVTGVLVLEEMAVSADKGTVDSGGRTVGSGPDSIVVEIIKTVVEVSIVSRADEVAAGVIELPGVEEKTPILGFDAAVVGDCVIELIKPIGEEERRVDLASVARVPSPSRSVELATGFEVVNGKALGQRTATASPENIIPIKVSGKAFSPLQALLMLTVKSLRKLIHWREHA